MSETNSNEKDVQNSFILFLSGIIISVIGAALCYTDLRLNGTQVVLLSYITLSTLCTGIMTIIFGLCIMAYYSFRRV